MRSILRIIIGILACFTGLAVLVISGIYLLLWSSLPDYDGVRSSKQISEPITIERDEYGVPTIVSQTRQTVSYGIGFCHGQERFFQMDMQRRASAGELSEILGTGTIGLDKINRLHGFRERARLLAENLSTYEKDILDHYTQGVNEGLASLGTRPPEYWLLGSNPQAWLPEDTILVIYSFYLDLQNNPGLDYTRWIIRQTLPEKVVDFLDPPSHAWEAAIDGSELLDLTIPGSEAFSYLKTPPSDPEEFEIPDSAERHPGSNNWVVGPDVSVTGFPILASDPHLNLGVPNTWYKLSYSYVPEGSGGYLNIHGFSIPGLPGIVIGSNGSLAWGITNSSLDLDNLIILEPGTKGFPEYKTPSGTARIQFRREIIQVKGSEPVEVEYPYTQWGPIVGDTPTGEKRVRRWTAYHPEATNIRAVMTEQFMSTQDFLENSYGTNLPVQNFVLADKEGNIGWTLGGFLPERNGRNPYEAIYSGSATNLWTEKLRPDHWPSQLNPENERIWTANNRVFGDEKYLNLGSGDFSEFPRAYQIRDQLLAQEKLSSRTMTAIQHDNSVSFLNRWRDLLLVSLKKAKEAEPEFQRIETEVENWNGRADTESIGYTLIRDFRKRLTVEVLRYITQPCKDFDPENFDPYRLMTEEAIYQIVSQQPDYLLNPVFENWQAQFEFVLSELAKHIRDHDWEYFRWGNRNQSDYSHPITYGVPWLGSFLNMPKMELDGDHYCPKVMSQSLVSGVRMVVSPGKLEDGLFQMGGGQSGHPLSPHYRDLHKIWSGREYLPFLPGEPVHHLTISPR